MYLVKIFAAAVIVALIAWVTLPFAFLWLVDITGLSLSTTGISLGCFWLVIWGIASWFILKG